MFPHLRSSLSSYRLSARPLRRHPGPGRRARAFGLCAGFVLTLVLASLSAPDVAHAELRLCNRTPSRIGVAVGYKDGDVWTTEGWWNVSAESCETLVRGDLTSRFYYLYAVDYDQGGEWSGKSYMCSRDKEFTIRGLNDCLARGFERTGFMEVDTKEQKTWTLQLTLGNQTRLSGTSAEVPLPPTPPSSARKGDN